MTSLGFASRPDPEGGRVQGASAEGTAADPRGPARILVVEDEWLVASEIESALDDEGFEVVGIAATAEEAVRMAKLHGPDLVLMDIRIRGRRDGIDAALEMRRRFGLRSLFVSAHGDGATRERAEAADPVGWVTKPFSGPQLLAALEEALRRLRT